MITQSDTQAACGPGPASLCSLYCGVAVVGHSWLQRQAVTTVTERRLSESENVELCTGSSAGHLVLIFSFNSHNYKAGVTIPFLWVKREQVILKSGRQGFAP